MRPGLRKLSIPHDFNKSLISRGFGVATTYEIWVSWASAGMFFTTSRRMPFDRSSGKSMRVVSTFLRHCRHSVL